MHAYRIEFQWQSALRGQETRAMGFRSNKGERLVYLQERYRSDALPRFRALIICEAMRAGMKDVRVKITAVVGLSQVAEPKTARTPVASVPAKRMH